MPIISAQSRSFRWLLAELSVVILGILIALQVDEWRIENSQRDYELVTLGSILLDLESESRSLSRFLDSANRQVNALKLLAEFGNDERAKDEQWVSDQYRAAMLTQLWEPSTSTYEGLRSSGNFDIISNKRTLGAMVDYFESTNSLLRILIDDMRNARDQFLLVLGRDIYYLPTSEIEADISSLEVAIVSPISDMPRHPDFYSYYGSYAYRISILTVRLEAALDANSLLRADVRDQIELLES